MNRFTVGDIVVAWDSKVFNDFFVDLVLVDSDTGRREVSRISSSEPNAYSVPVTGDLLTDEDACLVAGLKRVAL